MTRAEIDRLLALYSSGRISAADRAALYTAALDDPTLFEELFEEDALREALADPGVREAVLSESPSGVSDAAPKRTFRSWLRWPAFAAVAAAAVLAIVIVRRPASEAPAPTVEIAQHRPQPSEVAPRPGTGMMSADRAVTPDTAASPQTTPVESQQKARLTRGEQLTGKAESSKPSEPVAVMYVPPPAAPAPALVEAPRAIMLDSAKPVPAPPAASRRMESEAMADAPAPSTPPPPARLARDRAESVALAIGTTAVRPVTASLAARGDDGEWRDIAAGASVSQDTPLRLTVRAANSGTLIIAPEFTTPVVMKAGETKTFDLPRQEQGRRVLRVVLRPDATDAQAKAFRSTAGALEAAPGTTARPAPTARGEIPQPVEIRFEVR